MKRSIVVDEMKKWNKLRISLRRIFLESPEGPKPIRKLATLSISFALGVFAVQYHWLPGMCVIIGVVGFVLGGFSWFFRGGEIHNRMVLIALGLLLSCIWQIGYEHFVIHQAEQWIDTDQSQVEMVVCDVPHETTYGKKVTVLCTLREHRIKAVYYADSNLLTKQPGDVIIDDIHFVSAVHMRENDVSAFSSRGVFVLAYSRGTPTVVPSTTLDIEYLPAKAGQILRNQIHTLFNGDTANFLVAILTGDKTELSTCGRVDLTEAGIYHILAVSGMHCVFLFTLLTFLIGRHRKRLLAIISIPVLIFYAVLAGGSPSVVRASIMLIFVLIAPLLNRQADLPTSLTTALFLILLHNPYAAKSISLQLSFAAVTGILWATPKLYQYLVPQDKGHHVKKFLAANFSASLGALIFIIPLTAYYFNSVVLVAPLANLLCLWAATVTFMVGLISVLASFLWMAPAEALGFIPNITIPYILKVSHELAHLPYHALYTNNPMLKYWIVFFYLMLFILWHSNHRTRKTVLVTVSCIAISLASIQALHQLNFSKNRLNITAMDVGQGECVLFTSEGHCAVMDCGSHNSWYHAGERAAKELLSMGYQSIDALVLSHYDTDHINGVEELLDRLPVTALYLPNTQDTNSLRNKIILIAEQHNIPIKWVESIRTLPFAYAQLTLYPPVGKSGDNELGLSLLATADDYDFLVTGDMKRQTEKRLIKQYIFPDLEGMMVGHHGSNSSTDPSLLETLQPEIAIVSVGDNAYGHPASDILQRLKSAGVKVYRTDLNGDVHISIR